jgi:hypothetical protein
MEIHQSHDTRPKRSILGHKNSVDVVELPNAANSVPLGFRSRVEASSKSTLSLDQRRFSSSSNTTELCIT